MKSFLEKKIKLVDNKKGFTLVEVTVAAAIVVIVSVMLAYSFMTASNISKRANELKESGRNIDSDIHTNVTTGSTKESVNLKVTQGANNEPLEINGTEFKLPMNIYTFNDSSLTGTTKQMRIFRNPEMEPAP